MNLDPNGCRGTSLTLIQNAQSLPNAEATSITTMNALNASRHITKTRSSTRGTIRRTVLKSVSPYQDGKKLGSDANIVMAAVFHLQHCATACAAPKLFKQLK